MRVRAKFFWLKKAIPTPARARSLFFLIRYLLKGRKKPFASWVSIALEKPEPTFEDVTSQLVTEKQFYSPDYHFWCTQMQEAPTLHRKQWEFCFVLQTLRKFGLLKSGVKGLGFGVGTEPLPALFAKYGCEVLATDQSVDKAKKQGWTKSNAHSANKTILNKKGICDPAVFDQLVTFQCIDMADIPSDLGEFDFTWSCCSLEHIGSIEQGIQFINNSLSCLKKGGVAIHTTEFNLSSDKKTVSKGSTVLFRKKDIEQIVKQVEARGYKVLEVNFNPGKGKLDRHIDIPPYRYCPHFKLLAGFYVATSIGLILCPIKS